jgi:hypothetical protein
LRDCGGLGFQATEKLCLAHQKETSSDLGYWYS